MASNTGEPGVDYPTPGNPVIKCNYKYYRKTPRKFSLADLKRIVRYLREQNIDGELIIATIADVLGVADRICKVAGAIDALLALQDTFYKLLGFLGAVTALRIALTTLLKRPILRLAPWLTAILVLVLILVLYFEKVTENIRRVLAVGNELEWAVDGLVRMCTYLESIRGTPIGWLHDRAKTVEESLDDLVADLELPDYEDLDDVLDDIFQEADQKE